MLKAYITTKGFSLPAETKQALCKQVEKQITTPQKREALAKQGAISLEHQGTKYNGTVRFAGHDVQLVITERVKQSKQADAPPPPLAAQQAKASTAKRASKAASKKAAPKKGAAKK